MYHKGTKRDPTSIEKVSPSIRFSRGDNQPQKTLSKEEKGKIESSTLEASLHKTKDEEMI